MKKIAIYFVLALFTLFYSANTNAEEELIKDKDYIDRNYTINLDELEKLEKRTIKNQDIFYIEKDEKIVIYMKSDISKRQENLIPFLKIDEDKFKGIDFRIEDDEYFYFEIDGQNLTEKQKMIIEEIKSDDEEAISDENSILIEYEKNVTEEIKNQISMEVISLEEDKEKANSNELNSPNGEISVDSNTKLNSEIKGADNVNTIDEKSRKDSANNNKTQSKTTDIQKNPEENPEPKADKPADSKSNKKLRDFKKVAINGLQDLVGINNEMVTEENEKEVKRVIPHRMTGEIKTEPKKTPNISNGSKTSLLAGKNNYSAYDYMAALGMFLGISGVVIRKKSTWRN